MYELDFTAENLFVNLDLFSAHYSPVTVVDGNYDTKSLNSSCFTLPINIQLGSGIEACLKVWGLNMEAIKMDDLIEQYRNQDLHLHFPSLDIEQLRSYQPFKRLPIMKEWSLDEDEISSIQSITPEEIHAHLLDYITILVK